MDEDILGIIMIIIIVIGTCVVLPILIVWLTNKRKAHEMDKKSEILKTLLEKNPNMDPAEVMQKLNMSSKSNKTIKQKLLDNVFNGGMMLLMGLAILIPHLCGLVFFGSKTNGIFIGGIMLALGMAFIIYYFISKNQLQGEIEAEEKRLQEQQ
jgi:flagellar basal body-associated protein FliL